MKLFKDNVDNDNLMLVNVIHHRGSRDTEWKDYIDIVYKELDTDEKFVKTIEDPTMEVYFCKEHLRNYDFNRLFIDIKDADMHTFKFRNLEREIAKEAGERYEKYYKHCIATNNRYGTKNIHKCPFVFGSDFDIENWYRIQWMINHNNNKPKPVTKQFLDIEVDGINIEGFPEPGECEVNAVTIIDEVSKTSFTFLLRNPNNPQIEEFENNVDAFITELHEAFDESYGDLDYKIMFYDDELKMLKDLFLTINVLKRDFILIWNMAFDIPYLIERFKVLGADPVEIMCHPDFKIKELYFKKDTRNYMVENKSDFLKISSYTTFLDQMIIYAGLRKGGGTLTSNALSAVSQHELNDDKLDYSEDANIKTLPYVDYKKFVMYNIKDVLLQLGIERKTGDIDTVYDRSYSNATSYFKVFKQSVFLKNRSYLEFFKQGFIIGNNPNTVYGNERLDEREEKDKDDEGFAGALVANPELNDHTGMYVLGKRSKYIYRLVIDMDFSSMYPNIIITFNVSANTMIAKLLIESSIEETMNRIGQQLEHMYEDEDSDDKSYDAGMDFVDNYLTGNINMLCTKWFNLPDITTMVQQFVGDGYKVKSIKFDEKYANQYFPMGINVTLE